jgi:tetratricopeptide (TPR) repeat protein
VRADPDYAPAYLERAFTTMNFVKGNDPSPELTKVIQLEPQNWRAYYMRGQEYGYWNNKLHLAIADYRRVVELQPGFAQAYCDMAFALRELQRMNEVQGLLQKCYALDPSEREVTKKVFAKIKAGEEQAAREMAAMANYDPGGLDVNDPRVSQKLGAINSGQCSAAGGNWTGAYGCK